jgi:hypothetical protein
MSEGFERATMSGAEFTQVHGKSAAGGHAKVQEPGTLCLTPAQWAARDIPQQDRLLGDLYSTTTRTQLSADTGLGKTMFGLAVAFAMRLGANFLGWKAHREARVLYLDGEMPGELIKERLAMAASWFGVETPIAEGLHLLSREDVENMPPLDTPEGARWLFDFMAKLGRIDHVTFDNIASLTANCLKEEEGARALRDLQRELTRQRIGQLWEHHTGHDATRGYGSKMREWHLDTAIVAERLERSGADVAFTLKFPKCRRRTPENRSDFASIEVTLECGQWSYSPAETPNGKKGKLPDSAQLCLDALRKAIDELGQTPPPSSATGGVRSAVKLDQWRDMFRRISPYGDDQSDTRQKTFKRGTERLFAERIVTKWSEWVWLVTP